MLFTAILMFLLATMQLGVNFTRVIRGFIINEGHTEDYYNQLAESTNVFSAALYIVQTFVGDGIAVRVRFIPPESGRGLILPQLYRCYIVWNRRSVFAIFPGLTYIGSIVSGIGILVNMGRANANDLVFAQIIKHWITSFFSLTLATSTVCTLMIASRILYLSDQSIRHGGTPGHLHPIALVVIESGAIYSSLLIALIILYVQEVWFQYIIVDMLSSIIGIVFSIIIVRIGLGIAIDPDTLQSTMHSKSISDSATRIHELSTFHASTSPLSTVASDNRLHHHQWPGAVKIDAEKKVDCEDVEPLKHEKSIGFKTQV
ncbi:hypothetical protein AN958_02988 [Leucoagaricus sp. SymC.cos]|nr:hypothetical protein AN958_02988 [Leucoagaricus sp. SymC.cos]